MSIQSPKQKPGDSLQQAMSTITAQWYNAVVAGCGLDPTTFQLFQGNTPIAQTSEGLWSIVDVIPPLSVNYYFNPAQMNIFSQDYGSVITNLKATSGGNFETDMGDYYNAWTSYLKTGPTIPSGGLPALFLTWAQIHIGDTQTVEKCYADLQEEMSGPVITALTMWGNAQSKPKAFNGTIEQLTSALEQPYKVTISMNSSQTSSDVTHTWANGEVFGAYDFFEGEGSVGYTQISTMLAQSTMTIDVTFQHLVTFPLAPLAQGSDDPTLKAYKPWYYSAALALAYKTKDNTVWNDEPPTWNDCFGANGDMLRTCNALVVVDGIDMTITSTATFTQDQQTQIQASMEAGCWPFFVAKTSGGWTSQASFNDDGSVTIKQSSPAGNPMVLGGVVSPISQLF